MNKTVVILISLVCLVFFAGLLHYGWTNRWGGHMDTTIQDPLVLAMPQLDKDLTLIAEDFHDDVWQELNPLTVPLLHQITVVPWAKGLVPKVEVRAFHNDREAYFLLEWSDQTASRVHDTGKFPDGVAVAFPLSSETTPSSIMMGFQSPVNIWQWKADLDSLAWGTPRQSSPASPNAFYTYRKQAELPTSAPEITSACQDLIAVRPGTVTPKENSILTGRGQWQDGSWRVIIKRALSTSGPERDAQLLPGQIHVSFAIWDGSEDDRGSRKSISEWLILQIKSSSDSPPPSTATAGAVSQSRITALPTIPAVILKAVVTSAVLVSDQPARLPTDSDEPEPVLINILAKRFVYNPSEITVQKGQLVTIRMESLDVTHGLYIDGYGIDIKARPGIIGKATFLADKPGRFTFRCSETCGEFHPYMIGYLNVEPNRRYHLFVVVALGVGLVMAALILLRKKSKGVTSNE